MYKGMELKSIEDVLHYWQEWINRQQPGMPDVDPEDIKGHIAHVAANDNFEEWEKQYPVVREIVDLAYELDLPDNFSRNHKEAWEGIKARVASLKNQLGH